MSIKTLIGGNYKVIIVYIDFRYNLYNYLQSYRKNNEAVYLQYLLN